MADPDGGPVLCHNDVCLENVVFRDGQAVALLDFDFAAPGRRSHDVAAFARMCVPVDDDVSAARSGWLPSDRPRRLRLVCDAYGLEATQRREMLDALSRSIARGGEFVRRHVEAGESGFIEMWAETSGSIGGDDGGPKPRPPSMPHWSDRTARSFSSRGHRTW